MRRLLALLSCAGLTFQMLAMQPSATLPAGITRGASVEGITEYGLSNGLRVLLFPDATKTTTTVNLTYLVGSRNENYGETGMAHLLEHMLFKGSPKHRDIPQELTEHGTRPNGTTSYDRTNYYETFQSSPANLEWALDLESDRMVNSFVAKNDLDSEMTVVRNEFERGENDPGRILEERVLSTAYLWHNYGKSTIGSRSDIEHVPIERLQDFYHRYYQPDNAVLTIAGNLDEAKTLVLVAKYFGSIPKPARVLPPTYTEEPVQDGERTVTLRRTGDSKIMMMGVHVPSLAHPDGALASVVGDVFTNAPSGRLYKSLVETRKASGVGLDTTDTREPGMLILMAFASKDADLKDIESVFTSTVDGIETKPPTDEEANRSKTKLVAQYDLLIRNSERLGLFLSEFIAAGDWRLAFLTRDRIRDAKTSDIARVSRYYLKESNRTVGLFYPTDKVERAEVPPTPDITALVKNYKGSETVISGETFDSSPANIDKRTIRGDLQPGLKLALVNKKTRGGIVNAMLRLHFGDVNSLKGQDTAGVLAGAMLMRGSAKHSRQQITDELNRLKAQVRIMGSASGAIVNIQTTRENFAATLDLVTEILRRPAFPAEEFETLKRQHLTMLESQMKEPDSIAPLYAERHIRPYPKGDVRYVQTLEEQVEELRKTNLPDVQAFYTKFFGANRSEFSAVGDLDAESLEKQLSSSLGNWKSQTPYVRIKTEYQSVPPVNKVFETPDKANSTFVAILPVNINDDAPDYPALALANYMLGGGFLNSRLAVRIRVKEGLSYGVGSQLQVLTEETGGTFLTYAISAPQNVSKVESDFQDEVSNALKGGFTEKELSAAKSGWLQSRQVSRGQDNELAGRLASQAYWGRTMAWDQRLEDAVTRLTVNDVNAALRKYIDPKQVSYFKAGDFSKNKEAASSAPSAP